MIGPVCEMQKREKSMEFALDISVDFCGSLCHNGAGGPWRSLPRRSLLRTSLVPVTRSYSDFDDLKMFIRQKPLINM